jgi:hypothetical protein
MSVALSLALFVGGILVFGAALMVPPVRAAVDTAGVRRSYAEGVPSAAPFAFESIERTEAERRIDASSAVSMLAVSVGASASPEAAGCVIDLPASPLHESLQDLFACPRERGGAGDVLEARREDRRSALIVGGAPFDARSQLRGPVSAYVGVSRICGNDVTTDRTDCDGWLASDAVADGGADAADYVDLPIEPDAEASSRGSAHAAVASRVVMGAARGPGSSPNAVASERLVEWIGSADLATAASAAYELRLRLGGAALAEILAIAVPPERERELTASLPPESPIASYS